MAHDSIEWVLASIILFFMHKGVPAGPNLREHIQGEAEGKGKAEQCHLAIPVNSAYG